MAKTVMVLQDKMKKDGDYDMGPLPLSENDIYKVAELAIRLIEESSDIYIKQVCVEIIAVLLNSGDIEMLEKLKKGRNFDEDFYCFLFNELNSTKAMVKPFNYEKLQKRISPVPSYEHMTHHSEFERIINFNHNALDTFCSGMSNYDEYRREYYEYSLEIVFVYAMKISAHYKLDLWIKFCRFFNSYKHVNFLTYVDQETQRLEEEKEREMENPGKKDISQMTNAGPMDYRLTKDLKNETKMFMIQSLTSFVTHYATTDGHSKTDISRHISKLINIAFGAANAEDMNLKKVGLTLIIELVKKFQYTQEAVDQEDAETIAQMEEEMGLIIEQYEAQISSIIRQNLKKDCPPEIKIKTYDLLYYFITVPISRDSELIGRILSLIISDLDSISLLKEESASYDRIVSEAHFEKLELLCKLYLLSKEDEDISKFYSICLNPKNMNEEKDLQNISNAKKTLKKKGDGPKEMKERIFGDRFKEIEGLLKKQLLSAIYDSYIVLAMPRSIVKNYKRFIFITCGMRSAYSLSTIERTVQYFMKCLCYLVDSRSSLKESILTGGRDDINFRDIFEKYDECKDHEMLLALIQFYLVSEIEIDEENSNKNSQTSVSHSLYNHIKIRLFCMELMEKLFRRITVDFECLREILTIFDKLSFISVTEINSRVIRVCLIILERISKSKQDPSQRSILTLEGDDDLSDTKMCEKELLIVKVIEKLGLKIMNQIQSYVYQDINLGDLKKKLLDKSYEGLEAKYLNSKDEEASKITKLNLLKGTYDLCKTSLTTYLGMKAYSQDKGYLTVFSKDVSECIKDSFESTIHRTALKMPLSVKSYINHLVLIDEVFKTNPEVLAASMNKFIIRLIYTIKTCNSLGNASEKAKESSEDDSESNSENFQSVTGEVLAPATAEKLKTTIPYLIQLLNKTVANSISSLPMKNIKDGFVFYMGSLFDIEKENENSSQIVNFTQIALKGINGLFAAGSKDPNMMERVTRFSKF